MTTSAGATCPRVTASRITRVVTSLDGHETRKLAYSCHQLDGFTSSGPTSEDFDAHDLLTPNSRRIPRPWLYISAGSNACRVSAHSASGWCQAKEVRKSSFLTPRRSRAAPRTWPSSRWSGLPWPEKGCRSQRTDFYETSEIPP